MNSFILKALQGGPSKPQADFIDYLCYEDSSPQLLDMIFDELNRIIIDELFSLAMDDGTDFLDELNNLIISE